MSAHDSTRVKGFGAWGIGPKVYRGLPRPGIVGLVWASEV